MEVKDGFENKKYRKEMAETPSARYLSNSIEIDYSDENSSHEVARQIIKTSIEPLEELEQKDVLSNVRVVLFGGTITKSKKPKDYDLMIIYDQATKPEKEVQFSSPAGTVLQKLFYSNGEVKNNVGYSLPIKSKNERSEDSVHAQYVEIWLKSKESLFSNLKETPEEIKKRAFSKLVGLPNEITAPRIFYDGILYSAEQEEEDRRPATVFILTLARAFDYTFSVEELERLSGRFEETSLLYQLVKPEDLPDTPKGRAEIKKRVNEYILQMKSYLDVKEEDLNKLVADEMNEREKSHFAVKLIDQFMTAENLSVDAEERTRWIFESLKRSMNPEMGAVKSGQLLKGKNIIYQGEPLFEEDRSFLS